MPVIPETDRAFALEGIPADPEIAWPVNEPAFNFIGRHPPGGGDMVLRTECMVHHWPLALIMSTSLAKAALCAINFKPEHSLKICGEKGGACPSAEKYFIIRQIRDIIRDKSSKICFCATKTRSALMDWRSCEGFHPSTRPELGDFLPFLDCNPGPGVSTLDPDQEPSCPWNLTRETSLSLDPSRSVSALHHDQQVRLLDQRQRVSAL